MTGEQLIDRVTFLLDAGLHAGDRLGTPEGLVNYAKAVMALAAVRDCEDCLGSAFDSVLLSGTRKFLPSASELVGLAVEVKRARVRTVAVQVLGKGSEPTYAILRVEDVDEWRGLSVAGREERIRAFAERNGYELAPRALGVRDRG